MLIRPYSMEVTKFGSYSMHLPLIVWYVNKPYHDCRHQFSTRLHTLWRFVMVLDKTSVQRLANNVRKIHSTIFKMVSGS